MTRRYLVALGSNRVHHRHGRPRAVLAAAAQALEAAGLHVSAIAPVLDNPPMGPSIRRYANTAAVIETDLEPPELLAALKAIEAAFGRPHLGLRWGARVLDLDIVLWEGGAWSSPGLTVPHVAFRERGFVLAPAARIGPRWRDPLTGLTVRQLAARHRRRLTSPA